MSNGCDYEIPSIKSKFYLKASPVVKWLNGKSMFKWDKPQKGGGKYNI